ncbi:MAG: translation elongation factor Ts [Planctomycetaceae bacterium]
MAEVTAAAVKALRDQTDMPMMMCKQALTEAGGDMNQAVEILKEKAGKRLEKRTDNATEEGRIFVKVAEGGTRAAMVEVQCESAPVASGEHLAGLGNGLVEQLLNGPGAASVDELLSQSAGDETYKQQLESLGNKIQEKMVVNRIVRLEGPVGSYVHHDGKTASLFQADGQPKSLDVQRDVAMHVAAMQPAVTNVADVDQKLVADERAKLVAEAKASGKPDNIVDKIVDGRMKTFYRDEAGVLVEQPFAKDDTKSVGEVLKAAGCGAKSFVLWRVGK